LKTFADLFDPSLGAGVASKQTDCTSPKLTEEEGGREMTTPLKFPPKMPLKVKQKIDEPPQDETDQINPPLRIIFQAFGNVTHEAEPPAAPVLDK
jgi:hypothetical protein